MTNRTKTTALLVSALLLAAGCAEEVVPRGTAITNVTVIDAVNGVRPAHTVVFDGDEIIAIAATGTELPPAATTIDGTGKYLIPGLWDMHVHLIYEEALIDSMPSMLLSYGVTSVRDTGGLVDRVKPVVERMRAPGAVAPRVFFAGPLMDGRFVVYDGDSRPEIGMQNSDAAMAAANVAALKAQGVDFIKVYEMVSPEVFDALVSAAREHELPIASHVPLSLLAGQAGAQADSMEHLRNIELDCASNAAELHEERLAILAAYDEGPGFNLRSQLHALQRDAAIANYDEARCDRTIANLRSTIQVPTLRLNTLTMYAPFDRADWPEALAQLPESLRIEWEQAAETWGAVAGPRDTTFGEWSLSLVGRMHAAGVPIGAGTDAPLGISIPGYSLHTELERLVEAGLTPLEAIESATVVPASFFSLQDEMGTIDIGKRADLVLLDADPLADITSTRRIAVVISKGTVFTPEELL